MPQSVPVPDDAATSTAASPNIAASLAQLRRALLEQ